MAADARVLLLALLAIAACGGGAEEETGAAPAPAAAAPAAAADAPAAPATPPAAAPAAGGTPAAATPRAQQPEAAEEVRILRESFGYRGGGRDPFLSLVKLPSAGPELGELQLVAIVEDARDSRRSVAVLREKKDGKRYKVREGERLGRMTISQIRAKDVVFAVEDFGTVRRETLSLRRQEDLIP